jgi:hypothetical protein
MPQTPTCPVHSDDQSLKNWLDELRDHDLHDTRGLLEGLAAVIRILAARLPAETRGELVPER